MSEVIAFSVWCRRRLVRVYGKRVADPRGLAIAVEPNELLTGRGARIVDRNGVARPLESAVIEVDR